VDVREYILILTFNTYIIRNLIFVFLIAFSTSVIALGKSDSLNQKETILLQPKTLKPMEVLMKNEDDIEADDEDALPRGSYYTPEQDSAYYRAIRDRLPIITMLNEHLNYTDALWLAYIQSVQDNSINIGVENLRNLPPEMFAPTPNQIVQREINIMNAFAVPFVNTYTPLGLKVPFDAIGRFFGVTEDVSPEIVYALEYTTDVQVVVYSIQATVIATLYDGRQTPGRYTFSWNGRNSEGKRMPAGDYVMEVRIGSEKYIRKRVVWN